MAQVHYARLRPSAPEAAFARWSVPAQVDVREWDGEFVVRSPLTAGTYHVTPTAGETIRAIQNGATRLDDIAKRVLQNADFDEATAMPSSAAFPGSAADKESLLALLTELEAIGVLKADFS